MSHKCRIHGCNQPVATDGLCWPHWEMMVELEAQPDYVDEKTALSEIEQGWPNEPLIMSLESENERATVEGLGWRLSWLCLG